MPTATPQETDRSIRLQDQKQRDSRAAGNAARKMAKNRGMSSPKAGAIGAGVQAAAEGEGVVNIGKAAASGWLWWAAFIALFDPFTIGFLLGSFYLNLHFFVSTINKGSKWFPRLALWQKIVTALVDVVLIFVLMAPVILVVGACKMSGWTGTFIRAGSKAGAYFRLIPVDVCGKIEGFFEGSRSGGGGGGADFGSERLTHEQAKAMLENAGISIYESRPGATRFDNIFASTIYEVINLKKKCDAWSSDRKLGTCQVAVTGGTESGAHAEGDCSHAKGFKIDIEDTSSVNRYITQSPFGDGGYRGKDKIYTNPNSGALYFREATHWDIEVACPYKTS